MTESVIKRTTQIIDYTNLVEIYNSDVSGSTVVLNGVAQNNGVITLLIRLTDDIYSNRYLYINNQEIFKFGKQNLSGLAGLEMRQTIIINKGDNVQIIGNQCRCSIFSNVTFSNNQS